MSPRGPRTTRSWPRSSDRISRRWTLEQVSARLHRRAARDLVVPAAAPEDALRSRELYPGRPEPVEVVESHISWVFLAGERAYKLRKPVVFPFLDYGTAERRRAL